MPQEFFASVDESLATPDAIRELNDRLRRIGSALGRVQGFDTTETAQHAPLSMSDHPIRHVGTARSETDAVNVRYLRDRSIVADPGANFVAPRMLEARKGVRVAERAIDPFDLVPLSQMEDAVDEGVETATAAAISTPSGVSAGTYGDATHVGQFTVDLSGRLTFAQDVAIASTGGVSSVAGGVGITNTPEPIVGAGTVDLDIFSLTTEPVIAGGDLFAFVDVSVGTSPSAQRKITFTDLASAVGGGAPHAFLSATHSDVDPSAPVRGGIVVVDSVPEWVQLALPAVAPAIYVLSPTSANDVIWKPTFSSVGGGGIAIDIDDTQINWTLNDDNLLALTNLVGTGIPAHTGGITWAYRSIVGTSAISVTNGDGVAGNPTIDLAATTVSPATYGLATSVAQFTVGADGRLTFAQNILITPAASSITGGQLLSRTNDTNVTLTLGGTPTAALLAATSLTLGWTGTLGLVRGGTAADLSATGGASQVLKQASVGAAVTVGQLAFTDISGSVTDAQVPDTITLSNLTQVTTRNHADLQTLGADDHTQYLLLAGRSGGQVAYGGTGSGDDLDLRGTSDATPGAIYLNSAITAIGATRREAVSINPTLTFDNAASVFWGAAIGGDVASGQATWTVTTSMLSAFGAGGAGVVFRPLIRNTGTTAIADMGGWALFGNLGLWRANGAACGVGAVESYLHLVNYDTAAGGTLTVTTDTALRSFVTANGSTTITTRRGVHHAVASLGGSCTLTTDIALDAEASVGANNLAVRAAAASIQAYSIPSFTVQTGYAMVQARELQLTGTRRATLVGTGRMVVI